MVYSPSETLMAYTSVIKKFWNDYEQKQSTMILIAV
jgi:hypothetical protein